MFPYIIQGDTISIVVDSKSYIIDKTHIAYNQLREAIKSRDVDAIRQLVEPKKIVLNYAAGNVSIEGDRFLWKGKPMHNALSTKMIEMLNEGFAIDPLVNFMHNLMKNPSKRAVDELYRFLEKGQLPITDDGYFLAYKKVRDDYKDCHSGTISNHVGAVVTMDRNEVDDDRDRTCSTGLHFCSQEYLKSFGGARTMILKINPADVVSIPSDYNDTKGRCCRYEVIGELEVDPAKAFTRAVQANANGIVSQEKPEVDHSEPESGSTAYRAGYRDGHRGLYHFGEQQKTEQARKEYSEGYITGRRHYRLQLSNPYELPTTQPELAPSAPPQEYNSRGRPLSMTPDAIRKRRARAAAKNQDLTRSMENLVIKASAPPAVKTTPNDSTAWPFPKV